MNDPKRGASPVQPLERDDDGALPKPASASLRFDPLRFTKRIVTAAEMQRLIAEAAYFRASNRAFAPGHEVEDWLAAEHDVAERVIIAKPVPQE
jgi:hypothetical protein